MTSATTADRRAVAPAARSVPIAEPGLLGAVVDFRGRRVVCASPDCHTSITRLARVGRGAVPRPQRGRSNAASATAAMTALTGHRRGTTQLIRLG